MTVTKCSSLTGLGPVVAALAKLQPLPVTLGPRWPSGAPRDVPSVFKDVKQHFFLQRLSHTSCQGQTMEGYLLFWEIVVI